MLSEAIARSPFRILAEVVGGELVSLSQERPILSSGVSGYFDTSGGSECSLRILVMTLAVDAARTGASSIVAAMERRLKGCIDCRDVQGSGLGMACRFCLLVLRTCYGGGRRYERVVWKW